MNLPMMSLAVLLIAGAPVAVAQDLEMAFQKLQEAEGKKDIALLKTTAAETCALARQAIAAPAPQDAAEKEAWSAGVARARSIQLHAEYALYAAAVQAPPATAVDLLSAIEKENPKSKYLDEGYAFYLSALNQTGQAKNIPAIAEKAIVNLPENEDLLAYLADTALSRKQSDRAAGYAERLIAVMNKHPKPESLSAADWERKRVTVLGRAHWIAGIVHSEKLNYYEADKDLRAALPLIKGNEAMTAAALFNLGVANYQLGKTMLKKALVVEAAKFSEQCAAINSPFTEQAWRNAAAMKTEAAKMR